MVIVVVTLMTKEVAAGSVIGYCGGGDVAGVESMSILETVVVVVTTDSGGDIDGSHEVVLVVMAIVAVDRRR